MKKYKEGFEDLRLALAKDAKHADAKKYLERLAKDWGIKEDEIAKLLKNPGTYDVSKAFSGYDMVIDVDDAARGILKQQKRKRQAKDEEDEEKRRK
jgi:hypothetical protein